MIKKLKQVLQPNPSVPYIRAGKEKEFAGIHKVLKTGSAAYTSNGQNDDEVYNASKVKVSPRPRGSKSPESSPKDSYGEGRIALKVSPDNSEDEYGGHDEEVVNEIKDIAKRYLAHVTKNPSISRVSSKDTRPFIQALQAKTANRAIGRKRASVAAAGATLQSLTGMTYAYKGKKEEAELDERAYDKDAVNKEIRKDKRIGRKEGKLIHRLLRGRTTDSKQDHSMGSIIRKEDTEINELSRKTLHSYIRKSESIKAIDKDKDAKDREKRTEGILRATKKTWTAKEEVEPVNELSNKLVKRYVRKARGDIIDQHIKGNINPQKGKNQRIEKRIKGLNLATKKEETELDEKSTHGATHQLRIARKTLLMPDAMAGVMGGPSKREAAEIIRRSRQRLKKNEPTVMTHENHIHMTVTHESNTKPLFKAKAGSDAEVRTKLESLKDNSKGYSYRVGVHNTKTGETWSGKPEHKFPGFGEEAINEARKGWNVVHEPYSLEKGEVGKSSGVSHFERFSNKRKALSTLHQKIKAGKTGPGYHFVTSPKGEKLSYNAGKAHRLKKEDLFVEQIPSIPPDQPLNTKPLKKASSIEGLARRGVKLRVAQKKHELLKKRII